MSYAVGVVAFVLGLLVSVMLHEAGHFVTAKRFGMKATRFFVGFGPTLWSTRRGETEYGVKAIPAGGFVKIIGMTPLEEVEPGDEGRVFWRQPALQRAVVLAAGSVVHLLIAVVVLYFVIATTGDPVHTRTTLTVDSTIACVKAGTAPCTENDPKAPARGVLEPGDRIVAINGQRVTAYDALRTRIEHSVGQPVHLTVVRDHTRTTVTLTPLPVRDNGKTVGRVGFYPRILPVQVGYVGAAPRTFTTLGSFFTSTVSALGDLPSQVSLILEGKPRSPEGAASVVDIARVSGQIAQAHVSVGARVANFMLIMAQLNFFVGVFNLLPLLPLDGGHLGILAFEQARSRLYRALGRRDPGRVDLMKVMPVTYAVVALFIGLSLLMLYAGIVNPIRIQ